MKKSLSSIVFIFFLVAGLVDVHGAEDEAPWKYVVVDKENADNKGILTLVPGAVIKPVEGSLTIISQGDTCFIARGEKAQINHAKYAPFTIGLEAPYDGYALCNIPVSIRRIGEPYSVMNTVADSVGLLEFADLPPGNYSITVAGRARGLYADNIPYPHSIDDMAIIALTEYPVKPGRILMDLAGYDRETETFSVRVAWNDLPQFALLPYTYRVTVNGKLAEETYDCDVILSGLSAGNIKIGVSGILPSGEQTEEAQSSIFLSKNWMSSVSNIADVQEEWQYFDLSGRKVSASNLKRGVNIRSNGRVSEKVNIVGR